jgi:hypothetical protein
VEHGVGAETGHAARGGGRGDAFLAQIVEDGLVERARPVPGVLVEIEGDLPGRIF